MQAILGRRSVRKYTGEKVSAELVRELLQAAMAAPSAGNEQPWHFVVIDEREVLDAIPKFHPYAHMLKEASLAIAVCGDLQLEKYGGFWVQDCAAATENMLIAANALGLGAVWLAIHPMEDRVAGLRKLLSLPEHVVPLCVVSIGYPKEEKKPANRYNEQRIRRNRW